jgi:hypothetical protein
MKYTELYPSNNLKKLDGKIDSDKTSKAGLIKYGSQVPISMDILERLDPINYLLKMGNKKTVTESQKELELGGKYWGEVTHKRGEKLVVENLIKQPEFFGDIKKIPLIDYKRVVNAFKNHETTSFQQTFKKEVLSQMAGSVDKEQFLFLNQLLLSMENNVITIPINYNGKSGMFQYKYGEGNRKRNPKETEFIQDLDFYAVFELLGPMRGKLVYFNEEVYLNLEVNFESTRKFLQENLDLKDFTKIQIEIKRIKQEIKPLYSFTQNNLLDLRT